MRAWFTPFFVAVVLAVLAVGRDGATPTPTMATVYKPKLFSSVRRRRAWDWPWNVISNCGHECWKRWTICNREILDYGTSRGSEQRWWFIWCSGIYTVECDRRYKRCKEICEKYHIPTGTQDHPYPDDTPVYKELSKFRGVKDWEKPKPHPKNPKEMCEKEYNFHLPIWPKQDLPKRVPRKPLRTIPFSRSFKCWYCYTGVIAWCRYCLG